MQILRNVSLKPYNTFGIDVSARYLAVVRSLNDLQQLLRTDIYRNNRRYILGGGSNILLVNDFDGLIIINEIYGINVLRKDDTHIDIRAGGGENWHAFVMYCVYNDFAGVENLALIPGKVGAAPIQNIGAYGVELKDVFLQLEAVNLETAARETFDHAACRFAYRNSYFKNEGKGRYFITTVTMRLNRRPALNLSYYALEEALKDVNPKQLDIRTVSETVSRIRVSKLPDPRTIGNSGSFFKNPEVSPETHDRLKAEFPDLRAFELPGGGYKLAAGWMIEQCGWRGKRVGNTGAYKNQALVLVNHGGATGTEVRKLAEAIQDSVKQKFGIHLTPEVNIVE